MFSAIFAGVASLAGALLTRRDAKKEAARVAAANRAEAARIKKANEAAAAAARKQNTQVRQNYYKNVVSDAQAAGINPLTALRTGGGAGYATAVAGTMANPVMMEGVFQAPTLSRNPLAAGLEAGVNALTSELSRQKNYSHDVKMARLRGEIQRANALSIHAATSDNIDYTGYGEKIPVKFGLKSFEVPVEIAKRLRIAPNDYIEAGIIQELFGESAEIFTAFAQAGFEDMYGIYTPNLLGKTNNRIPDPTRPEVETRTLTRAPFNNSKWSDEWRHHVNDALK